MPARAGGRSKARRHALDILFQSEVRQVPADQVLDEYAQRRLAAGQQPFNEYVAQIVAGISAHADRIDETITLSSIGWDLDRMPGVDRNALRIAVWELLYQPGIPDEVAISEAVGCVGELSTDESPAFVNGVLSSIAGQRAESRDPRTVATDES